MFQKETMTFGNSRGNAIVMTMFDMVGSFAEFERALIHEHRAEALAAAQVKTNCFGRPAKLTDQ